ncbi:MAG: type I-U CRISPR-associated protein Cas8c [Rhodobacteraceae bacterium]|nr:type I-U CRISPR-associated protein Cas8c [Paracoccaceae bacterium]
MAEVRIPVDLFNPGQVFACLGFVEAADILLGDATGRFAWDGDDATFTLSARGAENPAGTVLHFLETAQVSSLAPEGSNNDTENKWDVPTINIGPRAPFPYPDPDTPATLPAQIKGAEHLIVLDHWGDKTKRDNIKFWAGAGGYPGAALLRDACNLLKGISKKEAVIEDPFAFSAQQSSSFRFDWRRDYIPLDAGFSPNEHGSITMIGFPIVEILAALGLNHARPKRRTKLLYIYGVLFTEVAVPPLLMRAALTGSATSIPGASFRRFQMSLGWPGQEGQARCITDVQELPQKEDRI